MFKSLSLGGLSWMELGKRVYAEVMDDDVLGRSAQLSYYFLLALFPALLFLTSLLGYLAGEDSQLRQGLFNSLAAVLPGDASQLISKTVNDVTQSSGGGKLSFGVLATFWAASNGMGAISESLNAAYDLKESRPWWKVRLTAVGPDAGADAPHRDGARAGALRARHRRRRVGQVGAGRGVRDRVEGLAVAARAHLRAGGLRAHLLLRPRLASTGLEVDHAGRGRRRPALAAHLVRLQGVPRATSTPTARPTARSARSSS